MRKIIVNENDTGFNKQIIPDMDAFKDFLREQEYAECSVASYLSSFTDYFRHGFTEISFANECQYKQALIDEGKKAKTINLRIASLNLYNKLEGIPLIGYVKENEDPFALDGMEVEDYHKLVQGLLRDKKWNWYVAIKLLAATGLRIGEAIGVSYGDLRKGYCTVIGKGKKERTVYFSYALRETLYPYIMDKADDEKIIPYTTHYVRSVFLRLKRKYGIDVCCSPHEYRRFFARNMYESTHDLPLLSGLLGHTRSTTTERYIRKTQKQAMTMYARAQNW